MHFLNENAWIPIKISLKFVPKVPINNIPAMVQIMAWRRPGDKPLSGPMVVSLPTHICVARPQWVKYCNRNAIWVGYPIHWNGNGLLNKYSLLAAPEVASGEHLFKKMYPFQCLGRDSQLIRSTLRPTSTETIFLGIWVIYLISPNVFVLCNKKNPTIPDCQHLC